LHCQAVTLERALKLLVRRDIPQPQDLEEIIEQAEDDDLGALDTEFVSCQPSIEDALRRLIENRLSEFVVVE
jgi:hypothetical protein